MVEALAEDAEVEVDGGGGSGSNVLFDGDDVVVGKIERDPGADYPHAGAVGEDFDGHCPKQLGFLAMEARVFAWRVKLDCKKKRE